MPKVTVKVEQMRECMREVDLYSITREIEHEQMGTLNNFVLGLLGEIPQDSNELNALAGVYGSEFVGNMFGRQYSTEAKGLDRKVAANWRQVELQSVKGNVTIQYREIQCVGGFMGSEGYLRNARELADFMQDQNCTSVRQYAEWQKGRMGK